jgi:hypothetical protein
LTVEVVYECDDGFYTHPDGTQMSEQEALKVDFENFSNPDFLSDFFAHYDEGPVKISVKPAA